jgi:hypothetical protein
MEELLEKPITTPISSHYRTGSALCPVQDATNGMPPFRLLLATGAIVHTAIGVVA